MRSNKTLLILLFWLVLPFSSHAQQASTGLAPTRVYRDEGAENQVAKLFETARSQEKLSHLTRIRRRESLEEQVCTVSLAGTTDSFFRNNTKPSLFTFYKTLRPDSPDPELNRIATTDRLWKHKHQFPRYSVAVWRMTEPQMGETVYWVGVHLYWGAALEFFNDHFTDDMFYRNTWKESVSPACRTQQPD